MSHLTVQFTPAKCRSDFKLFFTALAAFNTQIHVFLETLWNDSLCEITSFSSFQFC